MMLLEHMGCEKNKPTVYTVWNSFDSTYDIIYVTLLHM